MPYWEVVLGAVVDFVFDAIVAFVNTPEGDVAAHKLIAIVEGQTPSQEQANSAGNEQAIDVTKRIAELAAQFLGGKTL